MLCLSHKCEPGLSVTSLTYKVYLSGFCLYESVMAEKYRDPRPGRARLEISAGNDSMLLNNLPSHFHVKCMKGTYLTTVRSL